MVPLGIIIAVCVTIYITITRVRRETPVLKYRAIAGTARKTIVESTAAIKEPSVVTERTEYLFVGEANQIKAPENPDMNKF
jgi:hypothetical protein